MDMRRNRRRTRGARAIMESLEARQLMSATFWNGRSWTINGDQTAGAPDDQIVVSYNAATRNLDLRVNGALVESRSASRVRSITIYSGAGDDGIWVDTGKKNIPVTVYAGDGSDSIVTGRGKDYLVGGDGDDGINGGAGNDNLYGQAGNDVLTGEAGNDLLDGGSGTDRLFGLAGNDNLYGGDGDDLLVGGSGKDWFNGMNGADTIYAVKRDRWAVDLADQVIAIENPALPVIVEDTQNPAATFAQARYVALQNEPSYPPPVHYTGELRARLIEEAVTRYKALFGTSGSGYWTDHYLYHGEGVLNAALPRPVASAAITANADHSTTNTQESGVDEADLVETDGNFIYTIRGHQLLVIDVRTLGAEHIVAIAQLDASWARGIYLVGNRLVVLSEEHINSEEMPSANQTHVWTFDVTDPTSPARLKTTTFSGYVKESRVIGDQLYLVVSNNLALPGPRTHAVEQTPTDGSNPIINDSATLGITSLYYPYRNAPYQYETEADYRAWLEAHIDEYLPRYSTVAGDSAVAVAQGSLLNDFWELHAGETLGSVMSIVNMNLQGDTSAPIDMVTTPGDAYVAYASQNSLYVGNTRASTSYNSPTELLKFTLTPGDIQLTAGGEVAGRVMNSYAIDEQDGRLRVVTEEWINGQSSHSLYVLADTGASLAVVGSVGGMGINEQIRSVVFTEDRAYVVTFRRIDPLFTVDLASPEAPVVTGELHVPGYSTYLYPVGRDHLIGIGVGDVNGRLASLQVSLFNVSDLANPFLQDQRIYSVEGWGHVSSAAQYDPHAFAYFAGQFNANGGVLAVPSADARNGQFSMILLGLDPATGFTDLGKVGHTTEVQRALRIGGNLYSVADTSMKVANLLDPSQVYGEVALPAAQPEQQWLIDQTSWGTFQIEPVFRSTVAVGGNMATDAVATMGSIRRVNTFGGALINVASLA